MFESHSTVLFTSCLAPIEVTWLNDERYWRMPDNWIIRLPVEPLHSTSSRWMHGYLGRAVLFERIATYLDLDYYRSVTGYGDTVPELG